MFHIVFVVTDSRPDKPTARNASVMSFNLPADPVHAKKGKDAIYGIVRRVVDERRGRGKQGNPLSLTAYGGEGSLFIDGDDLAVEIGNQEPYLIDSVGNLTQEDIDAMKRNWDHEQDRLAVLANAGVLPSTI